MLNTVAVATSKRATVIGVRHVGPASSFVRRVAAALALLLCAAPVLGTFHYATVAHVACPEDGELIDVPANAGGSHTAVANHSHQDGPTLLAQREPVPASFGASSHEHCAVALQARLRACAEAKSSSQLEPRSIGMGQVAPSEPPRLGALAVYRLAPKASPPQA